MFHGVTYQICDSSEFKNFIFKLFLLNYKTIKLDACKIKHKSNVRIFV